MKTATKPDTLKQVRAKLSRIERQYEETLELMQGVLMAMTEANNENRHLAREVADVRDGQLREIEATNELRRKLIRLTLSTAAAIKGRAS